jgi:hypothetical protein
MMVEICRNVWVGQCKVCTPPQAAGRLIELPNYRLSFYRPARCARRSEQGNAKLNANQSIKSEIYVIGSGQMREAEL